MCYCCVFVVLLLCYCCLLMCCCYLLFGYHCSVLSQSKADSLPQHRIELLTSSQVVKTEDYHCWFIFPNGGTEAYNCWFVFPGGGTEAYICWFIFPGGQDRSLPLLIHLCLQPVGSWGGRRGRTRGRRMRGARCQTPTGCWRLAPPPARLLQPHRRPKKAIRWRRED